MTRRDQSPGDSTSRPEQAVPEPALYGARCLGAVPVSRWSPCRPGHPGWGGIREGEPGSTSSLQPFRTTPHNWPVFWSCHTITSMYVEKSTRQYYWVFSVLNGHVCFKELPGGSSYLYYLVTVPAAALIPEDLLRSSGTPFCLQPCWQRRSVLRQPVSGLSEHLHFTCVPADAFGGLTTHLPSLLSNAAVPLPLASTVPTKRFSHSVSAFCVTWCCL